MSPPKLALLGLVAVVLPTMACYASTAYNCSYYYGYYDPYCGYIYYDTYATSDEYRSVSTESVDVEETPHPDPALAATTPDAIVNVTDYTYLAPVGTADDAPDVAKINASYPCNETKGEALTVCSTDGETLDEDGKYLVVAFGLEQPFPKTDDTNFFVVSFAFDADGNAGNNYTPPAEEANDYAGETDKWLTANYTPTDGWTLAAFAYNGTAIESVATKGRIILESTSAALIVPSSEFSVEVPGNRISVFRHTGDEGANGDWSGLVYPPLGAPLQGS